MSDVCFDCGTGPPFHTHHVVPRSKGGTATVTLCVDCHGKVHGLRMCTPELTSAALQHRKAKGQRYRGPGRSPFGYAADGSGGLVEVPEEQAVLARIRAERAAGASIREIAETLNEAAVPARGKRWHPTTISRVLKRAATRRPAPDGRG